ncbi:MAG: hypothetical protein ABQ298_03690 [Puniceicoccaceae bacterium]
MNREQCKECGNDKDPIEKCRHCEGESSLPDAAGYVAVLNRFVPVDPGSETLVKRLNDETTIKEIREWMEWADKGAASVIRVEIVKAT